MVDAITRIGAFRYVAAAVPSNPDAEVEGQVQAPFNASSKKMVSLQVSHFVHDLHDEKLKGALKLRSPWVYPDMLFLTVPDKNQVLAQKVFLVVTEFLLPSIGMPSCPKCYQSKEVSERVYFFSNGFHMISYSIAELSLEHAARFLVYAEE